MSTRSPQKQSVCEHARRSDAAHAEIMRHTEQVMGQVACAVAAAVYMDPLALYRETRGGVEEAYWRQFWLWASRTGFDLVEADMARVLTAYRGQGSADKHHDSIAHACQRFEDDLAAHPKLEQAVEAFVEMIITLKFHGDRLRPLLERARLARKAAA